MSKQTPLNALHREAHARMVDFSGWDMPVNYGSQIDEHHAVRNDAGMFDVSHMRAVDLRGPGVRDFLRYAIANNVDKLRQPGKALYSCLLREDGGVIDDLIVYFLDEASFRLVVNAGTADKDIAWLRQLIASHAPQVTLAERSDLAMLAVQGPNARAKVWQAIPGSEQATSGLKPFTGTMLHDLFVARTGYTGEDGFELMIPVSRVSDIWKALLEAGVRPCGLGARDTLRLEAGMNLYGQDMDETVNPLESGLGWTVDLMSPRDFVGKAALLAFKKTHDAVRRQVGLVLVDKGGVLRAHQVVRAAGGDGEVTSGTFSPTLNRSIGLARMPAGVAPGDTVRVVVRDKELAARVVKPPFARNGKALIS